MNAKLIALAGPAEGMLFPLEDQCVIGREKQNTVGVEDHSMSRRHCIIETRGARCVLRDLGSKNGTFVNDLPVVEHVLEDRDEIRTGNSVFLFLYDEGVRGDSVALDNSSSLSASTVLLRREDATYLDPDRAIAALPGGERALRDVRTLLRIGGTIPCLRAEGGFIVSARRAGGRTRTVSVTATTDHALRLKDPFDGRPFEHNLPLQREGDELRCALRAGQALELKIEGPR